MNNDDAQEVSTASSNEQAERQETATDNQAGNLSNGESGHDLPALLRTWTIGNVTTAASVAIFAFLLLKVMIVARGEPGTARALIAAASPVTVILDAFLSLAPLVIAVLAVWIAEWNLRRNEGIKDILLPASLMLAMVLAMFAVPLLALIGAITGRFVGGWIARKIRQKGDSSGTRPPLPNFWLGLVLGIFALGIVAVTVSGLWVPTENVSVKAGRSYAAYVLSSRDGWVALYDIKKRRVVQEQAENIVGREICTYPSSPLRKTVIQLLRPHAALSYPRCKT